MMSKENPSPDFKCKSRLGRAQMEHNARYGALLAILARAAHLQRPHEHQDDHQAEFERGLISIGRWTL